MSYTKYPRGSEWRKWDLHIHTPETKKNDQFTGTNPAEKWTNYIATLNATTEDIAVVGVTDYFSIENYFKFKQAISDGRITKKFDLIVPNIELRVSPVTGSAKPINLHCIFNPSIDEEITNRFLSRLEFDFSGSNYSAHPDDIKRLGRAFTGNPQLNDEGALKAGYNQYVIEIGVLRKLFKSDKTLRDNTIIVVANSGTDGASGAIKHSDYLLEGGKTQLDATRYSIYQFSDAIFSSSENDVLYFTGQGADKKEDVIEKCSVLMPCFHGCDAHENDKVFKPNDGRFCWIKADPTFEGLKQVLYEPIDRVKIQSYKPDVKNDRFVISQLEFIDSTRTFGNQVIPLNENLNAIIGGKSSGKSLLMYSAARSIDPEQVDKTSQRLKFEGYKLPTAFDFKVTWKNGETDTLNDRNVTNKIHKITYIPQLYINHLVERNNKEDLNSLVESILLQDGDFKKFYEEKKTVIDKTTIEIQSLLASYLQTRSKLNDIGQKIKEVGKSESIKKGIDSLKTAIEAGQKASNLNPTEFAAYNQLNEQKAIIEKSLKDLEIKDGALNQIIDEIITTKTNLLGTDGTNDGISLRGNVDKILDVFETVPDDVTFIVNKIKIDFDELLSHLKENVDSINIEDQKSKERAKVESIITQLIPFLEKISGQKELQKLISQQGAEEVKLSQAQTLEKQFQTLYQDYGNIRNKIVVLLNDRMKNYLLIQKQINDNRSDIGDNITLICDLQFKQEDFALYEQANKAALSSDHSFFSFFKDGLVDFKQIDVLFGRLLRINDNKLLIDSDDKLTIPLKQKTTIDDVLKGIVYDGFKLDYSVTYKGDDLLSMSPGKKGTVLLILFLQISSSEYPIFIDQPEDNLDNRTIYDLLCSMIKKKKRDRQIIIVSHNANLVIATDSENIIVANQEGQDNSGTRSTNRFEYVNGSLEHSFPKNETITELLKQQGIKEHACDILEGGDEAFKQRERKYSIKF